MSKGNVWSYLSFCTCYTPTACGASYLSRAPSLNNCFRPPRAAARWWNYRCHGNMKNLHRWKWNLIDGRG